MIVTRKRELHFNLGNYESITLTASVQQDIEGNASVEDWDKLDRELNTALEADINRARLITSLDTTQSSIHEEIWK
jgi:hypothetical protein